MRPRDDGLDERGVGSRRSVVQHERAQPVGVRERVALRDEATVRVADEAEFVETDRGADAFEVIDVARLGVLGRGRQARGVARADRLQVDDGHAGLDLRHAQVRPVEAGAAGVRDADRAATVNVVREQVAVDGDGVVALAQRRGGRW